MGTIRKIANMISPGRKGEVKKTSSAGSQSDPPSPFAVSSADPLEQLRERKSKLTEAQRLRLLQNAFKPFSEEAKKHLPEELVKMEKAVRNKMLEEGFDEPFADEAGEDTVSAILDSRLLDEDEGEEES